MHEPIGEEIQMLNGPLDGQFVWTADHMRHLEAEVFTSDAGRQHWYVLNRKADRWVWEGVAQAAQCRGK